MRSGLHYAAGMSGVAKQLASKPATLEALLAIPEENRRHEIIDGELIEKGAATGEHGGAQAYLHRLFDERWLSAESARFELIGVVNPGSGHRRGLGARR